MRLFYIFSPIVIVAILIITLVYLPIETAVNSENDKQHSLLAQREKIINRIKKIDMKSAPRQAHEYTWGAGEKDLGQAILDVQSRISQIANQNQIPELLLGPKGTIKEGNQTRFLVEFETETSLRQAARMLKEIEDSTPPIGIKSLDLRHISQFTPNTSDVDVYMRFIVWGWVQSNAK